MPASRAAIRSAALLPDRPGAARMRDRRNRRQTAGRARDRAGPRSLFAAISAARRHVRSGDRRTARGHRSEQNGDGDPHNTFACRQFPSPAGKA